ncbi:MAG: pirin family protein [Chitinophagales bacterium]|nr:pirin family protein [Chitinophagales bacterium]
MSIQIIRREEQADGQFNGGAVLEKRPVFYQQDNTFPYSNLFYWAHAWSENGSTIGLHPHQGFEILSFVLKGEIEHYDTKNKAWLKLKAGDVQIIRSGNGISHAEKLLPGSAIFQIWFDPDLQQSIKNPATYNDYFHNTFPVLQENGFTTTVFKGADAPIEMEAEGVSIRQLKVSEGDHDLPLSADAVYSIFVLDGKVLMDGNELMQDDFVKIENATSVNIDTKGCNLFIIQTPGRPSYKTYVELHS